MDNSLYHLCLDDFDTLCSVSIYINIIYTKQIFFFIAICTVMDGENLHDAYNERNWQSGQ